MGVRVLSDGDQACMYCSTVEVAFGPIFHGDGEHDADERIEAFLRWQSPDVRTLTEAELQNAVADWRQQEAAQWTREESSLFGEDEAEQP